MIRMRWLALALVCAATTAVSAQETKDTTKGKIKTATTKAAKNTKKAVVTGAKDTKNAVVTGAKDTKNAVKKGASDTKTVAKKTTHAVKRGGPGFLNS